MKKGGRRKKAHARLAELRAASIAGGGGEEGLMYRDMQSDIVQQLIRRLAAVRNL